MPANVPSIPMCFCADEIISWPVRSSGRQRTELKRIVVAEKRFLSNISNLIRNLSLDLKKQNKKAPTQPTSGYIG